MGDVYDYDLPPPVSPSDDEPAARHAADDAWLDGGVGWDWRPDDEPAVVVDDPRPFVGGEVECDCDADEWLDNGHFPGCAKRGW